MGSQLLDRIFEELDRNSKQTEELSKIVYGHAFAISIMSKIVIGIFLAILGVYFAFFSGKIPTIIPDKAEVSTAHDRVNGNQKTFSKKVEK